MTVQHLVVKLFSPLFERLSNLLRTWNIEQSTPNIPMGQTQVVSKHAYEGKNTWICASLSKKSYLFDITASSKRLEVWIPHHGDHSDKHCVLEFQVLQIEYPLGGGSHVYFLLQDFWVILLFDINVVLKLPWPDVTILQSDVIIVVPWQLSTVRKLPFLLLPPSGYSIQGTENCYSEVRKTFCCQSPLYGLTDPCQNPTGDLPPRTHFDKYIINIILIHLSPSAMSQPTTLEFVGLIMPVIAC